MESPDDITSPCGSFRIHLHYGVNCTPDFYRPVIFKYKALPWEEQKRIVKLVFYKYQEYVKSLGLQEPNDCLFEPEYITVFKPGVWDKDTLEWLLSKAVSMEQYEQAAVIRNELNERFKST